MKKPKDVGEYIANAPKGVQGKLKDLRATIKSIVPEVTESISYGMPYYGYKGRLVYFAVMKNHIGLYIPPPIIEQHKKDLLGYTTTKSAVHLPINGRLPMTLVKKLVKARVKNNEDVERKKPETFKICSRGHEYVGSSPCPICWPGHKKVK